MDPIYSDVLTICDRAHDVSILCIGDVMLDRFVYGRVERVSPEAPIPVMLLKSTTTMLGAAGNVARNVSSLGASSRLLSVAGQDDEAAELISIIASEADLDGNVVQDPDRRTTLKVRYVASNQQLLRVDSEDFTPLSGALEDQLCSLIETHASEADVILLSDYAKGVVTQGVISACVTASEQHQIPLIVDPKGIDFARYGAVTLLKPNLSELASALGTKLLSDADVENGLHRMLETIPARSLLVTRSDKGLSYLERGNDVVHFPAEKREVYDVSGAGDTSLAALGIALGTGSTLRTASKYALLAAGIAVGKAGTAVVSDEEIRAELARYRLRGGAGSRSADDPATRIEAWRREGLRVGFTNGCFDILHAGHLSLLEFAASHCDRLIVGLNSDASVSRLKGPSRPVNSEDDRARLLSGMKPVDLVMGFDEDTPFNLISQIIPDVLIKGGDYTIDTIVGADVVINNGGEVLIAPTLEGRSTTRIIARSQTSGGD